MIFDAQNLFTVVAGVIAQAITATARSLNVIDLGSLGISKGNKFVEVFCQVVTAFDSGADDGTLVVQLMTDSDANIASGGVVLHQTAAIVEAVLVPGYQFSLGMVPVNALQYLDLNFIVAGSGNFTAGALVAGLILDRQTNDA